MIGWIAFILATLGAYLAAKKKYSCWFCWLVSNILFGIYAIGIAAWPLLVQQIVFALINVYGMYKWKPVMEPFGREGC